MNLKESYASKRFDPLICSGQGLSGTFLAHLDSSEHFVRKHTPCKGQVSSKVDQLFLSAQVFTSGQSSLQKNVNYQEQFYRIFLNAHYFVTHKALCFIDDGCVSFSHCRAIFAEMVPATRIRHWNGGPGPMYYSHRV